MTWWCVSRCLRGWEGGRCSNLPTAILENPPVSLVQEDTDCQSASLVSVLVDSLLCRLHDMFPEVTAFSMQSVGA